MTGSAPIFGSVAATSQNCRPEKRFWHYLM